MALGVRTAGSSKALAPIEERFAELAPAMTGDESAREASRCLYCFDAPCTRACPTHIDVPAFIKKIATGNLRGSARTILEANTLGASCARVCPTEVLCEGACVYNGMAIPPIQIGRLQRHATDWAQDHQYFPWTAGESTGKRVAILGAGPAGLACAARLRRYGHETVVFDANEMPGGLNTYGVAEYKMKSEQALLEIEAIRRLGVELRMKTIVGRDVQVSDILSEYQATFIGFGLGAGKPLGIPGEDTAGVVDAIDFIAELKTKPKDKVKVGNAVCVVGGGNTAIDAVTQSSRLGADKVYLVYRRRRANLKAYDHEVELALRDGVELLLESPPVRIEGNGKVEALVVNRPSGEERIPCDMVIRAIGQRKFEELYAQFQGMKTDAGRVVVDSDQRTTLEGVYAGGDCANGGKEVVNAVADGQKAAEAIHHYLVKKK